MIVLNTNDFDVKKCGTVTVSVYKNKSNQRFFNIQTDTEVVLPVSYIIEDTLYHY